MMPSWLFRGPRRGGRLASRLRVGIVLMLLVSCGGVEQPTQTIPIASGGAGSAASDGPRLSELEVAVVGVEPWKHGATAAYSLIHDDFCASFVSGLTLHALPELNQRGLRAAFAAISEHCASRQSELLQLVADRHEVVSHSVTHPHITTEDAEYEIAESKRQLEALLGQEVTFFAFPYDEVNPGVMDVVRSSGYLGARGGYGRNDVNTPTFADPFVLQFDAFGPDTVYGNYDSDPLAVLDAHVDQAIAQGGWSIREVHGVEDDSWEPVPLDVYRAHLSYLETLSTARKLWVAPPSDVIRYRFAREHCALPEYDGGQLGFPEVSDACARYATPLTYLLSVDPEPAAFKVTQAGSEQFVEKHSAGNYWVTLDPAAGAATLE